MLCALAALSLCTPVAWADLKVAHNDGVAVWINGELVLSENIPEDGYGFELYSEKVSGVALSGAVLGPSPAPPLVVGDNVLAVMLKQESANSKVASFDLQLQTYADTSSFEDSSFEQP